MPLTDFWNRWRRRLPPPSDNSAKLPNLRETEKQRDAARRLATEELAAIVTMPSPRPRPKDNNRS